MSELDKYQKEYKWIKILNYSPRSILTRIISASIIAVIVLWIIVFVFGNNHRDNILLSGHYLIIILVFNILSESLILLDMVLNKYFPVPERIRIHLKLRLLASILLISIVFWGSKIILMGYYSAINSVFYFGLSLCFVFVTMMSNFLLYIRFTLNWLENQKEMTKLKDEKLKMDYNSLQDQLNPHFLFNNLSVLKSLTYYDQKTAIKFIENFTDVYRYVLQSTDKYLISLKEEINFINAFIILHKERLGDGLETYFDIEPEALNKAIAPLTLQLLIENAIKHNIASKENPLIIKITVKNNWIEVKNPINKKESSYSTYKGLKNLVKRYEFLSDDKIKIIENEDFFVVKIPLL